MVNSARSTIFKIVKIALSVVQLVGGPIGLIAMALNLILNVVQAVATGNWMQLGMTLVSAVVPGASSWASHWPITVNCRVC